jgi:hypothetical protein
MDFMFFLKEGFYHVLDINALDHVLFFIAVSIVFTIKQWKKVLLLVSIFTVAHTITFTLSSYNIIYINKNLVEFLIPVTILITTINNSLKSIKNQKIIRVNYYFTFVFGLIHGLGFSSYFKMLIDKNDSILVPLLEFALGIELVQILIVSVIIMLNTLVINYVKIKNKHWTLFVSFLLLIKIIPMIFNRFTF